MPSPGLIGLGGRSTDELVVLLLCGLGLVGVAPFAVARFLAGELLLGLLDTLVLAGVGLIAACVWLTRRVRVFSAILSVFYLGAMVVIVHMGGVELLGWAYPTLTVTFFLVRPRLALLFGGMALIALLPVLVGDLPVIQAGTDIVTLVLTVAFAWVFAEQTTHKQTFLHRLAHSDALTRIGNRRALEDMLRQLSDLRDRDGTPASLILFDVDHFKRINDTWGHEVGDRVLVEIAEVVNRRLRRTDVLFRIGGEEFVALAPGADAARTLRLAEELRELIESSRFTPHGLEVTVSLGVAEAQPRGSPTLWLHRADQALYEAKNAGRNTVRCQAWGENDTD